MRELLIVHFGNFAHILLLLVVQRVLGPMSDRQFGFEFFDRVMQGVTILLVLLNLLSVSLCGLFSGSILLQLSQCTKRAKVSPTRETNRRPSAHSSDLGHQSSQFLRLVTLRCVVALHRLVRLATLLELLLKLGDITFERRDLREVLSFCSAKFLLLAPFDL